MNPAGPDFERSQLFLVFAQTTPNVVSFSEVYLGPISYGRKGFTESDVSIATNCDSFVSDMERLMFFLSF